MNRASFKNQGKYYDKETAKELFPNPIQDYLLWSNNALFFKAFGGATHKIQSYQATSKPYYDDFGEDLFNYPEIEWDHNAVATKWVGYISTVDIKFSFPIFDDRRMYIESTCILDFYIHEDWQRKGHGTQLMSYMMKVKKIKPRQLSLYQPSKSMLRFMKKNYGLTERLKESLDVYTYFDILGRPGDPEQK